MTRIGIICEENILKKIKKKNSDFYFIPSYKDEYLIKFTSIKNIQTFNLILTKQCDYEKNSPKGKIVITPYPLFLILIDCLNILKHNDNKETYYCYREIFKVLLDTDFTKYYNNIFIQQKLLNENLKSFLNLLNLSFQVFNNNEDILKEIDYIKEIPTTENISLKDLIISGITDSLKIGDIQFITRNIGKRKVRHLYRNCPSILRWKSEIKEIGKEDIMKYPLCPLCRKRYNSV